MLYSSPTERCRFPSLMHKSVNEDGPQGAALMPAGPNVCFHTGHVLKLCEDKQGEENGGDLMSGVVGVMDF